MSRVTVLVPNYNGAAYLRQCLQSVADQTFADWCVVVGDDASVDESAAVVAGFPEPKFRSVRRPWNVGCYPNVNLLLGEANSPYIAVLNADDWWEPTFLATMVDLLDRAPDALLATCATRDVRNGTEVNVT